MIEILFQMLLIEEDPVSLLILIKLVIVNEVVSKNDRYPTLNVVN